MNPTRNWTISFPWRKSQRQWTLTPLWAHPVPHIYPAVSAQVDRPLRMPLSDDEGFLAKGLHHIDITDSDTSNEEFFIYPKTRRRKRVKEPVQT